jgi:chromate reductase, NAD(P)H dehydrogenase (quinone)
MSAQPITILGIPGSLREHSFNKALIQAAVEVAPPGVEVRMLLLHDIPLYNADVEAQGDPEPVRELKRAIADADGLLLSTPQYNRSVSGVLKNAIDWASRPPGGGSVLAGKPAAIIGATSGRSATEKAREALLDILQVCRCEVMRAPTIGVSESADHIEAGVVHSDDVREAIRDLLEDFATFIRSHALSDAAG